MEKQFKGKRALVTGSAQGIGRAIAEKLAEHGAQVIALDKDFVDYANECITSIVVDLTSWSETKSKLGKILPVDMLVNNAGVAIINSLVDLEEFQYDRTFDVNVKALINVTQTVSADMIKRKIPGSIVNLSSVASKAALDQHCLYCASKGAVDAFTRCAALELGVHKIRVNCVNPTVVMTELGRKIWDNPKTGGPMLSKIPLQRFAEKSDVVEAVIFLLSDKSSMITGINLPVDGGFLST